MRIVSGVDVAKVLRRSATNPWKSYNRPSLSDQRLAPRIDLARALGTLESLFVD